MTEDHDLQLVEQLADEFAARLRTGERPSIKEYTDRHPELAEIIRDTFEALAMMENMAPGSDDSLDVAGDDATTTLPTLKQLGDFRIIREVGRGGMGVVYEAEQVSLGRHVALKVLPSAALPDDKHIRRFEREAKSAAKLHHTNIVPVFGVGTEDDLHYYVMQFIQGLPLDEVIDELKKIRAQPSGTITAAPVRITETGGHEAAREYSVTDMARSLMTGQFAQTFIGGSDSDGEERDAQPNLVQTATEAAPQASDTSTSKLSETFNLSGSFSGSGVRLGKSGSQSSQGKPFTYWESVANIGLQVADAMHYAHDQGILHRDIKPSNLLLDLRGTAWVTDFGLAKATDQQDITHTGDILGTLRYMPPEAFEGKADPRSDVYSLGLTLYELLCFQPAFGMKDRNRLVKQVTTESAPRLEKLNPEIPRDLVTIIHKAIDRDPSHRYQNARELQEDLQRFLDDEPIRARRISTTERLFRWSRRNKGLAVSLALVCVLLLLINIAGPVMTWRLREETQKLQSSESSLREANTDLQARERELENTGRQLEAETVRANQEAAAARSEAIAKNQLADEADRQRALARRALYSSSLFAAQQAISTPEGYARAQDLLDEVRPQAGESKDLRGWEWYYLDSQSPSGSLVLQDFQGSVYSVTVSPDGKRLATGVGTGDVKIFDIESGRLLQTFPGHGAGRVSVAWSPDGTRLASGSQDRTARIWNAATGREELRLTGHTARVADVAWSPDGSRLATASPDTTLRTWNATTGEHLLTLNGHAGPVRGVDWSSDGARLVSGGEDRTVRIWDARTGKPLRVLHGHTGWVASVQFSPDDRRIASADHNIFADAHVMIWDAESGEQELALVGHTDGGARSVCWSPDGSRLATAGWSDTTLHIWDAASGEEIRRFHDHQGGHIFQCSWSPDGRKLATAGSDETVRIWDVVDKHPQPDFAGHAEPIRRLDWSPDGSRIASASMDATVRIWDVHTKRELLTFRGHRKSVLHVAWSPDGTRLASCGLEKEFQIWDAETGEVLQIVTASNGSQINAVAWSPDGTQIATGSNDNTVGIFDVETGNEVQRFRASERVLFVCWAPDGEQIAACIYHPGAVKVWDVESGAETASIPCPDDTLFHVSISPDGKRIAAGGFLTPRKNPFEETVGFETGVLKLWDMATGRELLELRGHSNRVWSTCWSRDGTRLLSADWGGRLILWDTATGRQLLVLNATAPPPGVIQYCPARFSPDELQIASTSEADGIRLWDATPSYAAELSDRLLPIIEARIHSNPTFDDLKLRAEILARVGQWEQAAESFDRALASAAGRTSDGVDRWFTSPWWVAGPYPNSLDTKQPPETHLDPLAPVPPRNENVAEPLSWEATVLRAGQGLNLGRFFHQADQISGYAQLRVYSPVEQRVAALFGADDAVRLWLKSDADDSLRLLHSREDSRSAVRDDEAVDVTLRRGWNILLAKVFNSTGDHGLFLRLSDDPITVARVFARNEKWADALAWWDRAYAERPDDPEVLLGRGRAALGVGRADVAVECFDVVLAGNEPFQVRAVAAAYADHARSLINLEQGSGAANSLKQARTLYEALLSGDAATDQDAGALADVLLADTIRWTVLEPIEMTSDAGASLTKLDDDSILAGGPNVSGDVYTIRTQVATPEIRAIRLEAIPDPSLPNHGPGRHPAGNFHLKSFRVFASTGEAGESTDPIRMTDASASYQWTTPDVDVRATIDDGDRRYWHVWGRSGERHTAVFELATPFRVGAGQTLIVQCANRDAEGGVNLGRFRLSVTDDPAAFESSDRRFTVSRIEDPWARLGAACAALGDSTQAAKWLARALEQRPDFAARRELVERIDELQTDLSDLVALRPDDPLLLRILAKRQAAAGHAESTAELLARTRSLTEALLAESPDDEALASFLAELLLDDTTKWNVLEPVDMTSEGGATLTKLDDDSVLAGGPNPDHDVYTITSETDLENITAIRLEALTDDSLPYHGPGRSGSFVMDGFRVTGASRESADAQADIDLDSACADFVSPNRTIRPGGLWHTVAPGDGGKSHVAVYHLAQPLHSQEGPRLMFEMTFNDYPGHPGLGIGRFRLSVTDDPAAFEMLDRRFAASRIENPWARLGAAYAAVGESAQAVKWFARALARTPDFAARRELVERIKQQHTEFDDLLSLRPDDPLLVSALAERQAAAGQTEAAAESFARARSLTEALLAESPTDESPALFLADMLLKQIERQIEWTVLEPVEKISEGGATLTKLEDNSVLAGGPNPEHDTYTVTTAPTDLQKITAIRLEALTDDSLPSRGPGRFERGRFVMGRFRVTAASPENPDSPVDIRLDAATADYFHQNFPIRPYGHWHVAPGGGPGGPCTAIFRLLSEQIEFPEDSRLKFEMTFRAGGNNDRFNLGRFRLSVTDDPAAFETNDQCFAAGRIEDPWERLGAAYAVVGDPAQAAEWFARSLEQAPDAEARMKIAEEATRDEAVLSALVKLRPEDPVLLVAYGKVLASQGAWDAAGAAFQRAANLDDQALPNWILTGYWTVGPYPRELEPVYPPELDSDPFRPVAAPPADGRPQPDPLRWQPTTPNNNGRISLGTDVGCNYVLTHVWSPEQREVAFQMGVDDALRLFVNGQLLFQSDFFGDWRVKEHQIAVTFQPGWNTVLMKVANGGGGSSVSLTLSTKAPDLVAARSGTAKFRALQLAVDGHGEEAVNLLNELMARFPQDDTLYGTRATVREKLKQWELAADDWGHADEVASNRQARFGSPYVPYLQHRARVHRRLQQWDKLLADWNALLEPARAGENVWLITALRAETYDDMGEWDQARADYDRAVVLSQNDASAQSNALRRRGLHFIQRGQWQAAADDFDAAAALEGDQQWWGDRQLAVLHLAAGDVDAFRRGVQDMDRRIGANPDKEQSTWLLWVHTLAPGMITDANRDRLLHANDTLRDFSRLRNAAAVLYRAGRFSEAAEAFAANPGGLEYNYLAALSACKAGDEQRAVELLQSADQAMTQESQKDPHAVIPSTQNWEFWTLLLVLKHEAEEVIVQSPLAAANQALAADPNNVPALVQRGHLAYLMGDEDAALADLNRALELKTVNALAYATRGAILLKRGQTAAARSDLETALELEPTEPAARSLADLLLADMTKWTVLDPIETEPDGGTESNAIVLPATAAPFQALKIETGTAPSPPTDGGPLYNEYQILAALSPLPPPGSIRGQYVRIEIPGNNRILSLAEVQVFQADENIALSQTTAQSSDHRQNAGAEEAVDGITDGDNRNYQGSLTHTNSSSNPWWEVDLGRERNFDRIVLWNRTDGNAQRLSNFRVRVLDASRSTVFEQFVVNPPNPSLEISSLAGFAVSQPEASDDGQQMTIQLLRDRKTGLSDPFQLSITSDPDWETTLHVASEMMEISNPWERLGAVYATLGDSAQSAEWFARALEQAPDAEARIKIAEQASRDEAVLAALVTLRPADPALPAAQGKRLAARGDWDAAAAAFQQAAGLDAEALPKWIQTGFWEVGPYPRPLEDEYPPESNPDPFQSVASVPMQDHDLPAELSWQPATVQPNGRIELGMEIGCNYVVTRFWSPATQEVALQLGDDDALRALVNGELLLETTPNRGAARPGEHTVAAVLQPGWNTILLKVRNDDDKSNVILTLSADPQDLIAARRGARLYEADRLVATGMTDEALALLGEMIEENSTDDELFSRRAGVCQQLGQWDDAVADWTRALELQPDDTGYHYQRATTLDWRLHQHEQALTDWNRLVELAPNNPWYLMNRSGTYHSLGQSDQAMTDINQAVSLSGPRDLWRAVSIRGGYFAQQAEWEKAAADLDQAFAADEVAEWGRYQVYREQAVLQLMAGNVDGYQAAISRLEEFLAQDANSDQALWLVFTSVAGPTTIPHEEHDRLAGLVAEKLSEQHAAWKPRLTAALHYRAGEYQQAADLFDQNPKGSNWPAFQFLSAMAHHRLGNHDQARKLFDEAAAWIQEQEDKEPGPAVPAGQNWRNWAVYKVLEREAAALVRAEGGQPDME